MFRHFSFNDLESKFGLNTEFLVHLDGLFIQNQAFYTKIFNKIYMVIFYRFDSEFEISTQKNQKQLIPICILL